MRHLFIGDTPVIKIHTGQDVSGYDLWILYIKPSGEKGKWPAHPDPEKVNTINYTCQPDDLDEKGIWVFQGQLTLDEEHYTSDIVAAKVRHNVLVDRQGKPGEPIGMLKHAHVSGSGQQS